MSACKHRDTYKETVWINGIGTGCRTICTQCWRELTKEES